jgi:hypothetical protein
VGVARSIPLRDLKAECSIMERSVLQGNAAAKDELVAHRPGGAANGDRTVRGWLRYFAVLHRRHAMLMEQPLAADADQLLLSALRSEPQRVLLVTQAPDDSGAPATLAVYPKSFEALVEIQKHDALLEWVSLRYMYLHEHQRAHTDADYLAFSQRALDEMTYQYQLLAWIVTTPGPGLPFDPLGGEIPEIPAHIRRLDVLDLLALLRAHATVNAVRLRVLRSLMAADTPGTTERQRPTWAMFFANAAVDLKTSTRALMRDHSLAEVLAMLQLHHVSSRDAIEDAKRETKP